MASIMKAVKKRNHTTVTGGRSEVITFRMMAMNPQREAVNMAYITPLRLSEPMVD
jgi:hypothetical protein